VESASNAGQRRDIILLGSTGSIGTQAADIISRNPDRFRLTGIAAGGGHPELLARQAVEMGVDVVAVASPAAVPDLRAALAAAAGSAHGARRKLPEVTAGADAIAELAAQPCDVVLNAVTGAVGLGATLAALRAGRVLALVEFTDGSTLAQASPPDMRIPIALALGWPERVPDAAAPVDWTKAHTWTFEPLDEEAFPAVPLARQAGAAGGTAPAVYNAANEVCVAAFLAGQIPFAGIVDTVAQVVSEHHNPPGDAVELADVLAADGWARDRARELTGKQ
jgi:1-deoxy-D-xylulose 5-phosphate reductoisomerase